MSVERLSAIGILAFSLAPGNLERLKEKLPKLVPVSLPCSVAYELVLQSHLFFGFAQAIEAAKLFCEFEASYGLKADRFETESVPRKILTARGESLCRRIYDPNFDRLQGNMRAFSPELATWMIDDGYGKVLSRPGPETIEREIASIVFLGCSGHPVQLFSHVRGAKNLGASSDLILKATSGSGMSAAQCGSVSLAVKKAFGS